MQITPKNLEEVASKLALEIFECIESPQYFIENFCKLKDQKSGTAIPFALWKDQVDQLKDWESYQFNITLKSRQIGVSWESAAYVLWNTLFKKFFKTMIISRKEPDAIKYLDKVKFMYENLPDWFKLYCPLKKPATMLQMEFKNDASIIVESSNPEAGRSETLNLLIIDEAAFIQDSFTIWTAAEPTLEKAAGKAIIISTANGYDKFFQPKWQAGISKENEFNCRFMSWQADPNRTQSWYDRMERTAKSENRLREFHQEFPRNAIEAFIVSGQTFFDPELIQTLIERPQNQFIQCNLKKSVNNLIINPHSKGYLKIWEKPIPGEQYAGGVDGAEGIENHDFSVCTIYNRRTKKQVAELSGHIPTDEFAHLLFDLGRFYNYAVLNIEMNSIGESILNYLVKQAHYPNVFRQMRYDERSSKKIKKLGWKTTNESKRIILDAMEQQLRDKEMFPLSQTLFAEMKTFMLERTDFGTYKFKASGNNHDDHVMAHALTAIIFLESPVLPPIFRKTRPDAKQRFRSTTNKQDSYSKLFC
jgi:hypothetical protein